MITLSDCQISDDALTGAQDFEDHQAILAEIHDRETLLQINDPHPIDAYRQSASGSISSINP